MGVVLTAGFLVEVGDLAVGLGRRLGRRGGP
jgi:hypothetical protein